MRNLPNAITFLRLVAVVPVVLFLSLGGAWRFVGGALFLIASLSDVVDGYLARSRGQVTELGKLADPVVDKVLLLGGVLPLVAMGEVDAWLAVVIFGREFAVMGLRCLAASRGRVLPSDLWGKLKTVVYTISVTLLIFGVRRFGLVTLYIGVAISILSAFNYFRENIWLLE